MIEQLSHIVGAVLIVSGAFFFVVGAVGIYRMPDVFTRMHAAGISDTVGAGLLLVGMMFWAGLSLVTVKLAIILLIILFTSPIATHALAQAALHAGLEPILTSKKVLAGQDAADRPKKSRRTVARARQESTSKRPVAKAAAKARKAGRANRRKRS